MFSTFSVSFFFKSLITNNRNYFISYSYMFETVIESYVKFLKMYYIILRKKKKSFINYMSEVLTCTFFMSLLKKQYNTKIIYLNLFMMRYIMLQPLFSLHFKKLRYYIVFTCHMYSFRKQSTKRKFRFHHFWNLFFFWALWIPKEWLSISSKATVAILLYTDVSV